MAEVQRAGVDPIAARLLTWAVGANLRWWSIRAACNRSQNSRRPLRASA